MRKAILKKLSILVVTGRAAKTVQQRQKRRDRERKETEERKRRTT